MRFLMLEEMDSWTQNHLRDLVVRAVDSLTGVLVRGRYMGDEPTFSHGKQAALLVYDAALQLLRVEAMGSIPEEDRLFEVAGLDGLAGINDDLFASGQPMHDGLKHVDELLIGDVTVYGNDGGHYSFPYYAAKRVR
jgi:hypothetical protein